MRRILVAVVCLAVTQSALGRDFYVDNVGGDDSRDGSAPTVTGATIGPFRTIGRALRATKKGDRVILAKTPTPYRGNITLQGGSHSGYPRMPFTLIGNGATLDGRETIPSRAWSHHKGDVYKIRLQYKSYARLFLDGQAVPMVRVPFSAKKIPDLAQKQGCIYRGHVYFRTENGNSPLPYNFSLATQRVGITLYEVRHVVIQDLNVVGFQLDGINAHDGVVGAEFINLQSQNHGRAGFAVTGASSVRIEKCKSDAKLHTAKPARVVVQDSQLGM